MYSLALEPFNPSTWQQYRESLGANAPEKLDRVRFTPHSLCVTANGAFLAGVQVFRVEDSGFAFLEHLVTNPTMPLRLRHRGVELLMRSVRAYAAATSMSLYVASDVPSIVRMLQRHGFEGKLHMLLRAAPVMPLGSYEEKKRPAESPQPAVAHDQPQPRGTPKVPERKTRRKKKAPNAA